MATLLRRQPGDGRTGWALLGGGRRAGRLGGGTLRGGGGPWTDCQIYWSQTDGELRYVIRLEHTTTRPFQDAKLRCVPEGFILVRAAPVRSAGSEVWRTEGGGCLLHPDADPGRGPGGFQGDRLPGL